MVVMLSLSGLTTMAAIAPAASALLTGVRNLSAQLAMVMSAIFPASKSTSGSHASFPRPTPSSARATTPAAAQGGAGLKVAERASMGPATEVGASTTNSISPMAVAAEQVPAVRTVLGASVPES